VKYQRKKGRLVLYPKCCKSEVLQNPDRPAKKSSFERRIALDFFDGGHAFTEFFERFSHENKD